MPVNVVEKLHTIRYAERSLRAELGRDPRPAEIAKRVELPVEEVERTLLIAQTPMSLDAPAGDGEESGLGRMLADKDMPLPEDAAESVSRLTVLKACLGSLDDRQRRVLELRYGLDGGSPRTLEEIGVVFNVSRERIRQIERQSLRDLELLPQAQQLRDVERDRPAPLLRAVN